MTMFKHIKIAFDIRISICYLSGTYITQININTWLFLIKLYLNNIIIIDIRVKTLLKKFGDNASRLSICFASVVNFAFIPCHCYCYQSLLVGLAQSNHFAAGCKIMQHYVTNLYNIMQHYVIRGDISQHFRRLIAVNDRFCSDNLISM